MHPNPIDEEDTPQRIRVWLELGGSDGGGGTVEVGQLTTLGVRAILPGSVGVRIVDCAALDGLGESSQRLLDERGCPVDEQVSRVKKFVWSLNFAFEKIIVEKIIIWEFISHYYARIA